VVWSLTRTSWNRTSGSISGRGTVSRIEHTAQLPEKGEPPMTNIDYNSMRRSAKSPCRFSLTGRHLGQGAVQG
jgi:hypothetical protein